MGWYTSSIIMIEIYETKKLLKKITYVSDCGYVGGNTWQTLLKNEYCVFITKDDKLDIKNPKSDYVNNAFQH
jgi:hypothetical protein